MLEKIYHHPFIPKDLLQTAPDLYEYYYNYAITSLNCFEVDNEEIIILSDADDNLEMYSEKHKIPLNQIMKLIKEGYLEGKNHLREKIKEKSQLYPANGVKSYLINLIKIENKGNFKKKAYYLIGVDTKHEPGIIREIGFENAMYYEAWREVCKSPDLYNDVFIEFNSEKYKEESNVSFYTRFPKRFVIDPTWPDSVQSALDLNENCVILLNFFTQKQITYTIDHEGNRVLSFRMRPHYASNFNKICYEFFKEAANNNEKGLVEKNKKFYFQTVAVAEELINHVKNLEHRQGIISIIENTELGKVNLFEQMFRDLDITITDFKIAYPFVFEFNDSEIINTKNSQTNDKINETGKETEVNEDQYRNLNSFFDIKAYEKLKNGNTYKRIFKDQKAIDIFLYLHDYLATTEKTVTADYTFIFRTMQKDGYIFENVREREFSDFLGNNYKIVTGTLKPDSYNSTSKKQGSYFAAIKLFDPDNKKYNIVPD